MKAMGVIGGQQGPNDLEPHLLIDLGVPTLEPLSSGYMFSRIHTFTFQTLQAFILA